MHPEQLIKKIEAAVATLLAREPLFTGSLTIQANFYKGQAKDFVKEIERSREKIET